MSRKYPKWIKQQIEKIAIQLITKSNVNDDIIPVIKQAFEDLDYGRFDAKDMQFKEQLDKSPSQYPNDKDIRVKVLGLELGASKGELVYWYESLANKRGYSTKIKDLSVKKYKLSEIFQAYIEEDNLDKAKEIISKVGDLGEYARPRLIKKIAKNLASIGEFNKSLKLVKIIFDIHDGINYAISSILDDISSILDDMSYAMISSSESGMKNNISNAIANEMLVFARCIAKDSDTLMSNKVKHLLQHLLRWFL
jgi:hypothetical protein